MQKANILEKKKWLKKRRRENKIKKQHNYENKTHKGTNPFYLTENIRRAEREKKEEELKMKRMEKMFNLKGDEKVNANKKENVWRAKSIRKTSNIADKQENNRIEIATR